MAPPGFDGTTHSAPAEAVADAEIRIAEDRM